MTTSATPRPGPSWRRVLLTLAMAFAIPAMSGGIAGLVYAWRAQPLRAEADRLAREAQQLHHRFDQGGDLDKVLAEVLPRKQMSEAIRSGAGDVDALRHLVEKLPPGTRISDLAMGHQGLLLADPYRSWQQKPALIMTLRIPEPSAETKVIDLLAASGFTDPRIQSADRNSPDGALVEFSADFPAGGTTEAKP